MTRLLSMTNLGMLAGLGLVLTAAACGSDKGSNNNGGTAGSTPGAAGSTPNGTAGSGSPTAGTSGTPTAGSGPAAGGSGPGAGGSGPGAGGSDTSGGAPPVGAGGSTPGTAGSGGGGGTPPTLPPVVTSAMGAYWKTDGALADSTAAATVTVDPSAVAQKWDGMGAAFNELGWKYLTTADMQTKAINLLFSADAGANFAWGRIPIGASDYAEIRYTLEDIQGEDPAPNSGETNRPAADLTLSKFSLERDKTKLIPFIKAAQKAKADLRFWASPWTPPVWMKTGYKKDSGASPTPSPNVPTKPSYYDGGTMKSDADTLKAYAQYFTKFVTGYKEQGINIEVVSPQNEPGYDQNYPSCLWEKATYTTFIGTHLGPAMKALNVKVMLGTLSNDKKDFDIAAGPAGDATAKQFLAMVGAQWNTLDATKLNALNSGLPFWATEHKCGNYPWESNYNKTQAPNDQAYGVESWGYIRDAIKTVKVTSYSAWNMVLDKTGLGNDTSRDWRQDALLVADGGAVTATPAYYVFRHISQYVQPGANVISATGGDALAFKNPDGTLVAVMFNSGAANASYVVAFGTKKVSFAMPANGWATVKVKP